MALPSHCQENNYRQNGNGSRSQYHGHSHHGGSGSPFSEALDTFHAEFITQPIDYPLSNVSPPPPPLGVGGQHQQSAASDSTGSPVNSVSQAPPTHPPMSPSLPSFLDTYRHPSGHEMSPQVLNLCFYDDLTIETVQGHIS